MLCMVNFTTANIYNVHEHTLTCDLKNYMTPLKNINRRVPVEKMLYWLSKYDCNRCRRISDIVSYNCDIKISHLAVLLMSYVF